MKDTIDETARHVSRTDANAVSGLAQAAADAGRLIPPVWPLATSVAVNPYLGHANETLAETGERLGRLAGIPVTMPRDWYRQRIADKHITDADLAAALAASVDEHRPADLDALKAAIAAPADPPEPLPTVADLAARISGFDWPRLIDERIGAWAAGHFDAGQALWAAPKRDRAWTAWREWATHDLTPEIHGLAGFARFVRDAPADPLAAMARAIDTLAITPAARTSHFHHLLLSLGGWAQVARHRLWAAELDGATDTTLFDLIAIRLVWEEALFHAHRGDIAATWPRIVAAHAAPVTPSADRVVDTILQEAMERAAQRDLAATLLAAPLKTANGAVGSGERPALQAAFCIDVRSEVFRRALEGVSASIETLGFAGFFGVFTSHRSHASDVDEARLPVLLSPRVSSTSGANTPAERKRDLASRYAARATRAWGRFKLAAVSSFAFVEAMGPVYVWKLIRDGLGLAGHTAPNDPKPRFDPDLDAIARITAAETVLRAMSLTGGFARVVLLAGHCANVVNNPHASALHCGACGGHSGEVNARLLAGLLNDSAVRLGLRDRGIDVPDDTLFIAALHDTTTDAVTLYDHDHPAPDHAGDLNTIRGWLAAAGARARTERAMRLPNAQGPDAIAARARDWSEVRPEWALAGCKAFIAAPRARTRGRNLEGRAFLHDYDWRQDKANGFAVLELIMTAPVVVASWISLQYYGSATAPEAYGGGNKLLHNVVGGIGVLEGNGGPLRAGLPWQSVHDGARLVHEPLRLTVMIEAPVDAMTRILDAHPDVRALFDNRWLHLMALDASGRIVARYDRGLEWQAAHATGALST